MIIFYVFRINWSGQAMQRKDYCRCLLAFSYKQIVVSKPLVLSDIIQTINKPPFAGEARGDGKLPGQVPICPIRLRADNADDINKLHDMMATVPHIGKEG